MTVKNKKSDDDGDQFSSYVTVSHRGQVAIPIGIRQKLNIKTGDRLLVIVRKNKDGINLIKSEVLNEVFDKFSK